jgi:hypothetical protein
MKLYAYCVTSIEDLPTTTMQGIGGAPVKTLVEAGLVGVVSDFVGDLVPVTRENILEHEKVVRTVLERSTPLPFRFGTLVDLAGFRSYLLSHAKQLHEKLREVSDCLEMGVKIIWSPSATDGEPIEGGHSPKTDTLDVKRGPGSIFLIAKKDQLLEQSCRKERAKEIVEWLHSSVSPFVVSEVMDIQPQERLVVSCAHLVRREALDGYRTALSNALDRRPDLHFLSSGPWAPYSFVNITLSLKLTSE